MNVKENIQSFVAGIGFAPMVAIGSFIAGALLGEVMQTNLPTPPQWFHFPAAFFPICFALFLRAFLNKHGTSNWLDLWHSRWSQKAVDRSSETVEEFWMKHHLHNSLPRPKLFDVIDNTSAWGWAALLTLLPLAYICIWYGVQAAQG